MASKVFDRAKSMPTDAEEKANEKSASQLFGFEVAAGRKKLDKDGMTCF